MTALLLSPVEVLLTVFVEPAVVSKAWVVRCYLLSWGEMLWTE